MTRARLDEVPQLWDVLRGRMSVVGPRPEDPAFVEHHPVEYEQILSVRPGMTGISQLAYAGESSILDVHTPVDDYLERILPQKLIMDTLYARYRSLRLDLAILYWTVATILLRRPVAVNRTTGRMNIRRRPAVKLPESVPASASLEPVAEVLAPTLAPTPARESVA